MVVLSSEKTEEKEKEKEREEEKTEKVGSEQVLTFVNLAGSFAIKLV